jgi:hypothetical protein
MPKKKAQGAISRTQRALCHILMSDLDAAYEDLGADNYERKANIRRRARDLERLGYKVTIEPFSPDPETTELPITKASQPARPRTSRQRSAPPAAAACPANVLFSGQPDLCIARSAGVSACAAGRVGARMPWNRDRSGASIPRRSLLRTQSGP